MKKHRIDDSSFLHSRETTLSRWDAWLNWYATDQDIIPPGHLNAQDTEPRYSSSGSEDDITPENLSLSDDDSARSSPGHPDTRTS